MSFLISMVVHISVQALYPTFLILPNIVPVFSTQEMFIKYTYIFSSQLFELWREKQSKGKKKCC